jgi:hypothetical protein
VCSYFLITCEDRFFLSLFFFFFFFLSLYNLPLFHTHIKYTHTNTYHKLIGTCTSCPVCPDGQYRHECKLQSEGVCTDCDTTKCSDGEWLKGCSGTSDGNCVACDISDLQPGEYLKNCAGRNNGTITQCVVSNAEPDFYFTTHGGLNGECNFAHCQENCDSGMYRFGCVRGGTTHGNCGPCTNKDPDDTYYTSDGKLENACESSACDTTSCPNGEFRYNCGDDLYGHQDFQGTSLSLSRCWSAPTPLSLPTPLSISHSYHPPPSLSLSLTHTFSGECVECTNLPTNSYWTSNGHLEDACSYAACRLDCPIGQWLSGCGNSDEGQCVECTNLPTNSYWTSNGPLTDTCQKSQCEFCSIGSYRSGCGDTSEGYVNLTLLFPNSQTQQQLKLTCAYK